MEIREETGVANALKSMFFVLGICIFWVTGVFALCDHFMPLLLDSDNPYCGTAYKVSLFFSACILAPIVEEMLWRVGVIKILKILKAPAAVVFQLGIMSSIIFGYMHGGLTNVLIQGVFGMWLYWLYLKHNSYALNVLCHSLWNIFMIFGISHLAK